MSTASLAFIGWSPSDRVPGYYAESKLAQGAITAASLQKKCLVTGTKTTAGSATPSSDINQIFSNADTDAFHGAGSEINIQCVAALQTPSVLLFAAPVAEAAGATAGTITLTIAGTWTTSGAVSFWLDGVFYNFGLSGTDTPTTAGTALVNALGSNPRAPATAVNTAGAVAFTTVSKGVRSGDHNLFVDLSQAPAGLTAVISGGGSALTSTGLVKGSKFTAGTGVEILSALLTVIWTGTFDYIGCAQNDAVNLALWKAQVEGKAAITEGRLEQMTFGSTGTLAAVTSLAQTTMNETRASAVWHQGGENHPSEIAASVAAMRSVTEGTNPVALYDGQAIPGIYPNRWTADIPSHTQQVSAINNGVSPVVTSAGKATIGMLITTYCLFGATPDYRCLQTYYVSMPDYARIDLGVRWLSSVKPQNRGVSDDVPANLQQPIAGIATPSRVANWAMRIALQYQKNGWFTNVAGNLPSFFYDPTRKAIVGTFPCPVTPGNHQLGVSVRQLASPYPTA